MRELPMLDESRCSGCEDCVSICPTNCLEMAGDIPWLPRPRDCIICTLCVQVCPTGALRMAPWLPA